MDNDTVSLKFDFPTSWRHGRGLAGQTGRFVKALGCRNPLLLTDSLLMRLQVVDPVRASLEAENIPYTICDAVNYEPTVDLFASLTRTLDLKNFDAVIAVGGGSVLDVSKGLALIGTFGGDIRDYAGFDKVPGVPTIRTITVPTTAGTGSEISDGVVLIDEAKDTKFLVISKKICPTLALTDPLMTLSMPPKVTALSGIDALVHAVESYISKGANPMTESVALQAVKLLSENIQNACADGRNLDVREKMQIGSTMAMTAGMNSYLGLCHAMAMPLCALFHMPHGQAVGMALPAVLRFNHQAVPHKVIQILATMGLIRSAEATAGDIAGGLERLQTLLADIGVWARLKDFGDPETRMDIICDATLKSAQRPTNPRDSQPEDIVRLVRAMT